MPVPSMSISLEASCVKCKVSTMIVLRVHDGSMGAPAGPGMCEGEIAMRALEIDGALAEAHAALTGVLDAEWDWSGAELWGPAIRK